MKYCSKCGKEINDTDTFCPSCGNKVDGNQTNQTNNTLRTIAKVFMVIGTVANALLGFLIPLCWCIPMTVSYFNKVESGEKVSLGFKICTLLFVSPVAGILMLCEEE